LQMADISINPGEYYTFKEQDGYFHIILKKALLDKLHLEL